MNARALILSALLVGCTAPPESPSCVSQCGAFLFGSEDCAGFQNAETVFRSMGALHTEYSSGEICSRLSGWAFIVHRAGADGPGVVQPAPGGTITGQTWCDEGRVELGTDDWSANAYAHEAFHIVERCDLRDGGHYAWAERGLFTAIEATKLKCGGSK
jgi:hypothetical protein